MHIAYSALSQLPAATKNKTPLSKELTLRYNAYRRTCNKYSHEIAAIQKYLPGWQPKFNRG